MVLMCNVHDVMSSVLFLFSLPPVVEGIAERQISCSTTKSQWLKERKIYDIPLLRTTCCPRRPGITSSHSGREGRERTGSVAGEVTVGGGQRTGDGLAEHG